MPQLTAWSRTNLCREGRAHHRTAVLSTRVDCWTTPQRREPERRDIVYFLRSGFFSVAAISAAREVFLAQYCRRKPRGERVSVSGLRLFCLEILRRRRTFAEYRAARLRPVGTPTVMVADFRKELADPRLTAKIVAGLRFFSGSFFGVQGHTCIFVNSRGSPQCKYPFVHISLPEPRWRGHVRSRWRRSIL